jgi:hypothetical protein
MASSVIAQRYGEPHSRSVLQSMTSTYRTKESHMIAISNTKLGYGAHAASATAVALTFVALTLTIFGSHAVAKPKGGGGDPACASYKSCYESCTIPATKNRCLKVCDSKFLKCVNGPGKVGRGGVGIWPGGGAVNYPGDPSKPAPGRAPVAPYPITGPVFPAGGGVSISPRLKATTLKANTRLRPSAGGHSIKARRRR